MPPSFRARAAAGAIWSRKSTTRGSGARAWRASRRADRRARFAPPRGAPEGSVKGAHPAVVGDDDAGIEGALADLNRKAGLHDPGAFDALAAEHQLAGIGLGGGLRVASVHGFGLLCRCSDDRDKAIPVP